MLPRSTEIFMDLFHKAPGVSTRWISFENPTAARGRGGMANGGAKGASNQSVAVGETKTLCDLRGAGCIRRIWMTLSDRSPQILRAIKLEITWDDADTPAVTCPLADFFGIAHGMVVPHENALFSSPEGRSFNCLIPMPFRRACRVTLTNESTTPIRMLFYEIDAEQWAEPRGDAMYFHVAWRRERNTTIGRDFDILPRVTGQGRFLGCNIGVMPNPIYGGGWFGEGEVKIYLDGDADWPTLVGTGAEDYIGTGWGMKPYFNQYQGCSIASDEPKRFGFYRYHIPDPVYFDSDIRVTIQSMGGMRKEKLQAALARGAKVKLATVAGVLMVDNPHRTLDEFEPEAWCNHYREDDYCSTAYFYLDRPTNNLPPLAGVADRIAGVSDSVDTKRADV